MFRQIVSQQFKDQVLAAGRFQQTGALDRALTEAEHRGRTRADTVDVNNCVELAGRYASPEPGPDTVRSARVLVTEDRQGDRDRQAKTRALRSALRPYIEHVRTRVFGHKEPPFPTRAAASTWITANTALESRTQGGPPHLKRAQAALDKHNRLHPSGYAGLALQRLMLPSLRGSGSVKWVFVARGTPLGRIKEAVFVMEQATPGAFPKEALLAHLLTGEKLPRANTSTIRQRLILPRGTEPPEEWKGVVPATPYPQVAPHTRFVIELDEDDVTVMRFRRIYQAIRRLRGQKGMKRKTAFDWRLQQVVTDLGGLPPASRRRGFWAKVRRKLKDTKLTEAAIRERYRRLQQRTDV